MGAWGALLSEDRAADVHDDFHELIGDGISLAEATRSSSLEGFPG